MVRATLRRMRRAIYDRSGESDFAWRYILNLGPTLRYSLQRRPLRGEGLRVLQDLNRHGFAVTSVSALFEGGGNFGELSAAFDRLQDDMSAPLTAARAAARHSDTDGKKPFQVKLLGERPQLKGEESLPTTDIFARYPLQDPIPRIADAYFGMHGRLHRGGP